MAFSDKYEKVFRNILPSPFALAVGLTFFVFALALIFFKPSGSGFLDHGLNIFAFWYEGLWSGPFLVFGYQMMLILVLGHVLALTAPAKKVMDIAAVYCTNTARAAAIVCAFAVFTGFINWGLALIFGAVFARRVAQRAQQKGYKINYPLIAASGYTGLMVWHGGLSGSSLIKVAEKGHLADLVGTSKFTGAIPESIGFADTVFSPMNLSVSLALLLILPYGAYALGKNSNATAYHIKKEPPRSLKNPYQGWAQKIDQSGLVSLGLGLMALLAVVFLTITRLRDGSSNLITPNYLNTLFLGFGLIAHGSLSDFAEAVEEAISGTAGILIQFPLYFGIMGIMKEAGIVAEISAFFVSISGPLSYPIYTFLSAGLINILVPSGGGQWMVQGPIIIETSLKMGLPLEKGILAMAYGDQITNMLQPFWALPLLSITGLKAKDILPYTLFFMLIGIVVFVGGLLIFTA